LSLTLRVPDSISKKQGQKVGSKFDELILILNPNSQGGATGKNWDTTYAKIKEFLPKRRRIVFTKPMMELISHENCCEPAIT
jgi:hypothetical protein